MEQRKDGEHRVHDGKKDEHCTGNDGDDGIHWHEKSKETSEEEAEGGMQEERYNLDHHVHLESLEAVIQEREYACTDDGSGSDLGFVEKVAGPLFEERCEERTRQTEPEAYKPQDVTDEGTCRRSEGGRRGDQKYSSVSRGGELLGYLGK